MSLFKLIATWRRRSLQAVMFPYKWLRFGSPVKADETVVLFPQSASVNPGGGWTIPLHGWVVELESGTRIRRIGRRALINMLDLVGVIEDERETALFSQRMNWFMADREINKRVTIDVGGQQYHSPRTSPNGHFKFPVQYDGTASDGSLLLCKLVSDKGDSVCTQVQLVPPVGTSVISDIDDTIKISHVTSKRDLIRGIFFEKYKPVPGMPELFHKLASLDVCFHYVSSSPWQLFPSLYPLLRKHYPFGSLSQRHFYIGNRSFLKFFLSSADYKFSAVTDILERYPHRRFILVGDSGEKDPEIYCEIAARYGSRVLAILIREVPLPPSAHAARALNDNSRRWSELATKLPSKSMLRIFDDPETLISFTDQLAQSDFHSNRDSKSVSAGST